jgi:hypothetical protein
VVAVAGGVIAGSAAKLVPALPAGWRIVVAILVASVLGTALGEERPAPSGSAT